MPERWFRNAVIYCLDVDTFQDSDGDGVGDLPGLIDRLDHLARLGVTCIWLNPIHPTPYRDGGYDVADYYGVDPSLGNLGDFAEFMAECDERGIRVMLDLVLNHTSDEHPWFQAARSDPESPYRDWYVWSEEEPADRVLVHGAPGSPADGIEMTLALNHLSYFLLTNLLLPLLEASSPARIVNVASDAHKGVSVNFDDIEGKTRFGGWRAYQQSKLANILFTYELAQRLEGKRVTANALHPGFVRTTIFREPGFVGWLLRRAGGLLCSPRRLLLATGRKGGRRCVRGSFGWT